MNTTLAHSATLSNQLALRKLHLSLMCWDCNQAPPNPPPHLAFTFSKQMHYLLSHSTGPCHVILNFFLRIFEISFSSRHTLQGSGLCTLKYLHQNLCIVLCHSYNVFGHHGQYRSLYCDVRINMMCGSFTVLWLLCF